jgi:hypothetical protein
MRERKGSGLGEDYMKVDVMALVVRDKRTNGIVEVYPLDDMYTEVQLEFTRDLVSPEEIKKYVESYMGKNHAMALRASNDIQDTGVWRDQQEAKDFSSVGNMLIGIETNQVEWN